MIFFLAHLSTVEVNSENAFWAVFLSPASAESMAFLRSVFMRLVSDLLRDVRVSAWRTRLRADFELAMDRLGWFDN